MCVGVHLYKVLLDAIEDLLGYLGASGIVEVYGILLESGELGTNFGDVEGHFKISFFGIGGI
jgi:hypothetical protein